MAERRTDGKREPATDADRLTPASASEREARRGGPAADTPLLRSAAALQLAREQRPRLASLIHMATGAREQLELFSWAGVGHVRVNEARVISAAAAATQHHLADAPAERCPSCGAALGSGEDAHSMTGDNLADHLLDYHEGELGAVSVTYRRRKEQARAMAQDLRRGNCK